MFDPLELPAWQENKFKKVKEINLPVIDFGFIHCDSTYDAISTRNGKFVYLDAHLDRFYAGCSSLRINMPYDRSTLKTLMNNLLKISPIENPLVFIVITRGIAQNGARDLITPKPNFFMFLRPCKPWPNNNTVSVCISSVIRNDSIDQTIKNFSWNDLTMAQFEAIDRGYDTAILLSRDKFVTEGPAFNIGIIKNNSVYAPAKVRLGGITMKRVEDFCNYNLIPFEYTDIDVNELLSADAVFLTSTGANIVTVSKLENVEYEPHFILNRLREEV